MWRRAAPDTWAYKSRWRAPAGGYIALHDNPETAP
jgi:hypothetical protein